MTYSKWDIILVTFPFTNLKSSKKRPALVISPDIYNKGRDVVIAFITSKLEQEYKIGDYQIQNWREAGLPKPAMIRMKFATIEKSIIIKTLGRLPEEDIFPFKNELLEFFK